MAKKVYFSREKKPNAPCKRHIDTGRRIFIKTVWLRFYFLILVLLFQEKVQHFYF